MITYNPTTPDQRPADLIGYLERNMNLVDATMAHAVSGLRAAMAISHGIALARGWHHDSETGEVLPSDVPRYIALMHSELSEMLEADRKSLMDDKLRNRAGVEVELADLIIRALDTAAKIGADVPGAFMDKSYFNYGREDHSDEARAGDHGKRY